jgi:hypothetical protein
MKIIKLALFLATVILTNCTTSEQFLKNLLGDEVYGRDSMQENINAIKVKVLLSKDDTTTANLYLQLGKLYLMRKDKDSSLIYFQKMYQLQPKHILCNKALFLLFSKKLNCLDSAIFYYHNLSKLDPNNDIFKFPKKLPVTSGWK